jgi:hypothetical protein
MFARSALALAVAALVCGYAVGRAAAGPVQTPLWVMMYTTGPAWDATRAAADQRHFRTHSANLARLRAEGRIRLGGRFGPWGLILVDARSEAEARSYFAPDSALSSGVFAGELHAWSTIYAGEVGAAPPPP